MTGSDEAYWAEYDGLQHAKHQLLRAYLGGWFPILSSWQGRVLYVDCHAGRGRHETGHEGSPILALRLLKDHHRRKQILSDTEVIFYLFENSQTNFEALEKEISDLGPLPMNMLVHPHQEDYQAHLQAEFDALKSRGQQLAACFAFLDPYGFSISIDFINQILSFPASEVLVNFMYRYVNMAMTHESQAANMDKLFGTSNWRALSQIEDPVEHSNATLSLFSSQLEAGYVTHIYMRGENSALKYALVHATNHRKGRELIKDSMWSVIPDGTFSASERATPDQPVLIVPEPDLRPLEEALWEEFKGQSVEVNDIYDWLLNQLYLPKHLHEILRKYRNEGVVEVSGYTGRFAFNKNPTFEFPGTRANLSE